MGTRHYTPPEPPTWTERIIDAAEAAGAWFACALIGSAPLWLTAAARRMGIPFVPVLWLSVLAFVVVPALLPTKETRGLTMSHRWAAHWGRLLGAPLRHAAALAP